MNRERTNNPVLADTALLGRGLPSIANNLISYLWPDSRIVLPYIEEGLIKRVGLEEFLKVRNNNAWQRIDAQKLQNAQEHKNSGYLTASALMELTSPGSLVVTAGMGGITGQRVSQDLIIMAHKPVWFITSGFKDVVDAKASFDFLKSQGIRVMGWKNQVYNGFIFADQDHVLDGVVDENQVNNLDLRNEQGMLIINPLPTSLKLDDKNLLKLAGDQMNRLKEMEEDFHPVVNQVLDDDTSGWASLIQLMALIANINLAARINSCLGG